MSAIYSNQTQIAAVTRYLSSNRTKTEVAEEFNTSVRSLSRWIDKWSDELESVKQAVVTPVKPDVKSPDEYEYILTGNSACIIKNGETRIVHKSSPSYKLVSEYCVDGQYSKAWDTSDIKKAIKTYSLGNIRVDSDETVYYGTFKIRNKMTDKLVSMVSSGETRESIMAFCSFVDAAMSLENKDVIDQLWPFIEWADIKIENDGYFVGYKAVTREYLDKHTATIDNSVGKDVIMPRSQVEFDPNKACSAGLHIGSLDYAKGFARQGDKLVEVRCHVSDVVSVPYDYNSQKLRACKYHVVRDVTDLL